MAPSGKALLCDSDESLVLIPINEHTKPIHECLCCLADSAGLILVNKEIQYGKRA